MKDGSPQYSLLILMPDPIERDIRAWVEPTPGASLPFWGAHITLLNAFSPIGELDTILDATRKVCALFQPFTVRLDRAVSRTHLARPNLQAVFLTSDAGRKDHQELIRLHKELELALAPLRNDLGKGHSPPVYNPHLSLTWGLPRAEATRLLETIERAQLVVEFTVEEICLLAFSPNLGQPKRVESVEAFPLGAGPLVESP